jgi:Na+-driven multidrug efflux pump
MTIVDMVAGAERGLGYSVLPAFVSLIGICILRIVYIYTIFQMEQFHTMAYLYATYPISWLITAIAHSVCYAIVSRKKLKKIEEEKSLEAQKA